MGHKRTADASKAIGIIRVSTNRQELSPTAQRDAIAAWCERHGATLVAVFEDIGVSGATPLHKRAGMLAALAALKTEGAGLLVAAKRDRLARDPVIAAMIERAAEKVGATVRTADGASDGLGPTGRLMKTMLDGFAEFERAMIATRVAEASAVKRARGEKLGLHCPYGFKVADDGKTLVAHATEQTTLATVRELAAKGTSQRKIAAHLTAAGLKNRAGGDWAQTSIARMLVAEESKESTAA